MSHAPAYLLVESHVQAAWQALLAAAGETPALRTELVHRRHELFPRFAATYLQLRGLPRNMRRALHRQWRLPLAALALWLALSATPVQAATITVGGACTLVDAITAANTDTTTGGCRAGNRADTIVLPAGSLHKLTRSNNSTYGPTGLPVIHSVITIAGNGSTIARTRGEPFRILAVSSAGKLTLQETTVRGGAAPEQRGGGIANYGGTVALTNSTISGNSANYYGGGGGVYNTGTLTVTNSTISGNRANYGFAGGGVYNTGTLTVTNSTISGNFVYSPVFPSGGGVFTNGGTLTVTNSTIAGNSLSGLYARGGGVASYGTLTVTNSSISGNSADDGGGVANFGGTVTVTNSTISGNTAAYSGGGVLSLGIVSLVRTLISGNTAPTGPEIRNYQGTVVADNYNLFGVDGTAGVVGFSPGPTDIVPPAEVLLADILEPTLADNGGPTETHALVPGSPAIDAGGPVCLDTNGNPLTTDQRGQPRPVDGDGDGVVACDIGAFEVQP